MLFTFVFLFYIKNLMKKYWQGVPKNKKKTRALKKQVKRRPNAYHVVDIPVFSP